MALFYFSYQFYYFYNQFNYSCNKQKNNNRNEAGETQEEALIREIKEELELDITNLNYLTTVEYDYPNFHLIMHCFICEICGGTLSLNAHNDAKWVSLDKLSLQKWVPADIEVVERLVEVNSI